MNGQKENGLIPFVFDDHTVRTIMDEAGVPWFVAKDVCTILDIQNPSDTVLKVLDEDEKGVTKIYTPGGMQEMLIISESGLYTLIIRSNKPQAKPFRKWVTGEVLPSLRKTGTYTVPGSTSADTPKIERPRETTTGAIRTSSSCFPADFRKLTCIACETALKLGLDVKEEGILSELYLCYCKLCHTREPLAMVEDASSLTPQQLYTVWKSIEEADSMSSVMTHLKSFLLLNKVYETLIKETKTSRLEKTAKKAMEEYVDALYPSLVPNNISITINAGLR